MLIFTWDPLLHSIEFFILFFLFTFLSFFFFALYFWYARSFPSFFSIFILSQYRLLSLVSLSFFVRYGISIHTPSPIPFTIIDIQFFSHFFTHSPLDSYHFFLQSVHTIFPFSLLIKKIRRNFLNLWEKSGKEGYHLFITLNVKKMKRTILVVANGKAPIPRKYFLLDVLPNLITKQWK